MPYVGAGYRHTCSQIAADGYTGFRFEEGTTKSHWPGVQRDAGQAPGPAPGGS